jgi:hypothetical protein
MSFGEWLIMVVLMVVITVLAIVQTIRGREAPFKKFASRAALIGQALEVYARDHGGCYPPDGFDNQAPPGLSPKYIQWQEDWNVDYEVHSNGRGGVYLALEYLGHYNKKYANHALGLTRNLEYRQKYGQAQRIPGWNTRIWVFREQAPVCGN